MDVCNLFTTSRYRLNHQIERRLLCYQTLLTVLTLANGATTLPACSDIRGAVQHAATSLSDIGCPMPEVQQECCIKIHHNAGCHVNIPLCDNVIWLEISKLATTLKQQIALITPLFEVYIWKISVWRASPNTSPYPSSKLELGHPTTRCNCAKWKGRAKW